LADLNFEWDARKAAKNIRDHRVSFEEATFVWKDERRLEISDVSHSTDAEDRAIVIGVSDRLRLLFVVFTQHHEVIRIISARRANRAETEAYFARR
jgi:hypothetical protein